ncbi:LamG-like jellyroll fold domain-containing protein [Leptospira paudalimensis]|uniref:Concanavalin n=1 Tax=Leptospira paudalimensis TaxID=2950024 RepID=A0ABT3M3M3_9LEPT|nr:LamG-like jellyroll fold domain-containing protein [Leptospira paudalimensis]MCW7503002.1 concanavalin [Leptospira paudalimensis]
MRRIILLPFLFSLVTCSFPQLSRSPLDYLAFLRVFTGLGQTLGGAVSGLRSGTSVTLTNGNDSITITADGNFTFPTRLTSGQSYDVGLTTNGVGITCSLTNGKGVAQNSQITNVSVTCGIGAGFYEVGVNVSGISGSISVQNNAAETLTISSNGLTKFSTLQLTGSNYAVTITSQPAGTVCTFDNPLLAFGTIAATNVTIFITCINGYIVGGNLFSSTSSDLGTNLINRKTYIRTFVGSFPTNNGGTGPASGVAVATALPTVARFTNPSMLTSDASFLYVADTGNGVIRKIDKSTGVTTILAGGNTGGGITCPGTVTTNCLDGVGTAAQFNGIVGITTNGNNLFVLELNGNRIRIVNLATSAVSTFVGSGSTGAADNTSGILASFSNPTWLTLHNGIFYIVDRGNCTIRTVDPITSAVGTIAGAAGSCNFANNPVGTSARFVSPIAIVGLGSYLYVTDVGVGGGYKIRRIALTGTNAVDTLAGDGVQASTDGFGTSAQFNDPHGITTDGTNLFISEWLGHRIRHLNLSNNKVTTLVGSTSGYSDNATGNGLLNFPGYITTDGQKVYIADQGNHSIRFLEPSELIQYSFDGNANDSIGTNHGSLIGSPTLTSDENGLSNGAYELNGTSDYIVSSGPLTQNTDNITFSAWVHASANDVNQFILYNGLGLSNGYGLKLDNTGSLRIDLTGTLSPPIAMKVPLNRWVHVAVRRLSNNWQIFINGSSTGIVFSTSPIQPNATTTFKIGDAGTGNFFRGKISNVHFFNGALDDDSIQSLAVQVPTGLISYFPLNGNGKDYGNFKNDLTNYGAASTTDRFGIPNSAYYFNGASYFQKPNPNGLPTGFVSRTICAWFNTSSGIGQYIISYGTPVPNTGNGLVIDPPEVGMFGWSADAKILHEDFVNQWIHLCGVFDGGTKNVSLYENGTLRHSETQSGWSTGTSANLEIGKLITATGYFSGDLDDIRIYDRTLSVAEIRAISGPYPTQVSSWNQTVASSSLKFFLLPESANIGPGGCLGSVNCVSAWNDRSGNNFHVYQGSAPAQPVYNATGMNGVPVIRFNDASANYLSTSCSTELLSTSNTIFATYNDIGMTGSDGIFHNGEKLLYLPDITTNNLLSFFDLQLNNPKLISTGAFNIPSENILMSLDFNGTTGSIYKFGNQIASSSIPSAGYTCGVYDLSIGRFLWNSGIYPFNGDYLNGHIGDIIYFNQVLSTSDRELVECYLSGKYRMKVGHRCP